MNKRFATVTTLSALVLLASLAPSATADEPLDPYADRGSGGAAGGGDGPVDPYGGTGAIDQGGAGDTVVDPYAEGAGGDALDLLTITRDSERPDRVRVELQVRHDFRRVAEKLGRLALDAGGPLDSGPFVRARVLGGLFDALGDGDTDWCCTGDAGLPMPAVERPAMTNGDPLLAAFFQVCAACHRSDEPFPPNFLAGSPEQVRHGIAQCAERIQYRLAMWDHAPGDRSKSPMPPRQTVGLGDGELEAWSRGPLQRLRNALYQIAAQESVPLPARDDATARPYADLRACLPTS